MKIFVLSFFIWIFFPRKGFHWSIFHWSRLMSFVVDTVTKYIFCILNVAHYISVIIARILSTYLSTFLFLNIIDDHTFISKDCYYIWFFTNDTITILISIILYVYSEWLSVNNFNVKYRLLGHISRRNLQILN